MKSHTKKLLFLSSTLLILGVSQGAYAACDQTLSPGANVASAIASATAGSTICLNSGSYGTVTTGSFTKNPRVTIRSVSGQGASMNLKTNNGTNGLIFDSLTMGSSNIAGSSTKNITISNTTFGTNQLVVDTNNFNQNNILIDRCTFGAFNAAGTREGRLSIQWGGGPGSVSSGVTVTNSTFGPGGCSDGINIGSYGVVVGPGNVFTGMVQGSCSAHVDAIQGYGQSHTTVTGNFFSGNTVALGFYDGGNTEIVTNNVIIGGGGSALQMGTIASPLFEHNTLSNATVNFNGKSGNGATTNLLARNNLLINGSSFNLTQNGTPACTNCTLTHNQFPSGGQGTANIIGAPTFQGGASPSTWSGWSMTNASIGKNAATDAKDMGSNYFGGGTPPNTGQLLAPTNLREQ